MWSDIVQTLRGFTSTNITKSKDPTDRTHLLLSDVFFSNVFSLPACQVSYFSWPSMPLPDAQVFVQQLGRHESNVENSLFDADVMSLVRWGYKLREALLCGTWMCLVIFMPVCPLHYHLVITFVVKLLWHSESYLYSNNIAPTFRVGLDHTQLELISNSRNSSLWSCHHLH